MAIYRVATDLSVHSSEDYIALAKPVRYAKCVTNQVRILFLFVFEATCYQRSMAYTIGIDYIVLHI